METDSYISVSHGAQYIAVITFAVLESDGCSQPRGYCSLSGMPTVLLLLALVGAALSQDALPSQDNITDYAPSLNVECPDFSTTSLIREFTPQNQSLHPSE